MSEGRWIQSAVKHPGAETRAAHKAGESVHQYMEAHKNAGGTAGKRARLGLTLSRLAHAKSKMRKG